MFKLRVLTALALLPLVGLLLFKASIQTFAAVLAGVCLIGAWEWARMAGLKNTLERLLYVVSVGLIFMALWQSALDMEAWPDMLRESLEKQEQPPLPALAIFVGVLFWTLAFAGIATGNASNRVLRDYRFVRLLAGWLVLVPFWAGAMHIRAEQYTTNPYVGAFWLLFVLIQVWAADTGAYFCGKTWGARKLAPSISPGKTWEGALGGAALALLVAGISKHLLSLDAIALWQTALLSVSLSVFSVVGDLTESVFKRLEGLKDSGNLLPGHGGVLDRIDSLTASVPAFAALYFVFLS